MGIMKEISVKALAKINLGLDVVRRLENGYHEVKMVMQTVGIYDVLDFERTDGGIVITTDSGELPTDENNLIYKAAKLMMETYPISGGVKIHLEKHIPIAAGMAGGSTDAAATLKGMNRLFDLGCTLKDLMELGVKIGADAYVGSDAEASGYLRYQFQFVEFLHHEVDVSTHLLCEEGKFHVVLVLIAVADDDRALMGVDGEHRLEFRLGARLQTDVVLVAVAYDFLHHRTHLVDLDGIDDEVFRIVVIFFGGFAEAF